MDYILLNILNSILNCLEFYVVPTLVLQNLNEVKQFKHIQATRLHLVRLLTTFSSSPFASYVYPKRVLHASQQPIGAFPFKLLKIALMVDAILT